ncbi:mRNA cleavage and polyadenylation factor CLP1 [Neolecta irregularis DAH-3]|uniref:Polynucleotide 5'-hydroxyl-kinase GRC3 n=1 Tax=Neolecta irregularis (strain DAH-3) TaxID=1198029 RepID=A0A1U7LKE2_NEOID|nr:mRNA cleavage and polyadenylation factor CLP1 [Neolecta irregularis DAH-3]|eukprot:OLL22991.1 mRNA cleavage and polyadenylation factor CLP1 [Neolecta irregularis DAH-3]
MSLTDGPRAKALKKVLERSLSQTVSRLTRERLAQCFPLVAQESAESLDSIHGSILDFLKEHGAVQFQEVMERRQTVQKLNELDQLIEDAKLRKDTGCESAKLPDNLSPELLVEAHLMPLKKKRLESLQGNLKQNDSMLREITENRSQITQMMATIEKSVDALESAAQSIQGLVDRTVLEELVKELEVRKCEIIIYPVKSCRGVRVQQAQLAKTGLKYDRLFMFVQKKINEDGSIKYIKMTQREYPQNILFSEDGKDVLELSISGTRNSIKVPLVPSQEFLSHCNRLPRVDIWTTNVTPLDMGLEYSLLFTNFFRIPIHLTYKDPTEKRYVAGNLPCSTTVQNGEKVVTSFSDGYPIMLTTEESLCDLNSRLLKPVEMSRFRPNIVLKGTGGPWVEDHWKEISIGTIGDFYVVSRCVRCVMPNVDPETGIPDTDHQPFKTLQQFRRIDKGAQVQGTFQVGDEISVLKTGEHCYQSAVDSKVWTLCRETEYRFEADFDNTVDIKLISGSAEIFGTELTIGPVYSFTGYKGAVYTWDGCTLEVTGVRSSEYIAEETPMSVYANLHFGLEKLRYGENGPRVLLVGPDDSGKTSIGKILVAYAVRMGREIDFINLDTREGVLSLPGTISAVNFSTILDVEQGFGTASATGPSQIPAKTPLVYYYGYDSPAGHAQYYKKLISRAALAFNARLSEDKTCTAPDYRCLFKRAKRGVSLIPRAVLIKRWDTTLSKTSSRISAVRTVCALLTGVSHVVVVGHERLYSDMLRQFESPQSITVLKVGKSGGCVERDDAYIRKLQHRAAKQYFYGEPKRNLNAYSVNLTLSSQAVFRLADGMPGS